MSAERQSHFDPTTVVFNIEPLHSQNSDSFPENVTLLDPTLELNNQSLDDPTVELNNESLDGDTNHPNIDTPVTFNGFIYDQFLDNNSNNSNGYLSDNSGENFYEIDTDSDNEELPTYPISNIPMTVYDNDLPEFLNYDQDDQLNQWEYEEIDRVVLLLVLSKASHKLTYVILMGNLKFSSIPFLKTECGLFSQMLLTCMQDQNAIKVEGTDV